MTAFNNVQEAKDRLDILFDAFEHKECDYNDFCESLYTLIEDTWFSGFDSHIRHEAEIEK